MLFSHIISSLPQWGTSESLSHQGVAVTYGALIERAQGIANRLDVKPGDRIGVCQPDGVDLVATLLALDQLGAEAYLISGDTQEARLRVILHQANLDSCLTAPPITGDSKPDRAGLQKNLNNGGQIVLLTSGTTGSPKGARHTWSSLAAGIPRDTAWAGSRWLLTYGLTRFAGLQVLLQALVNGGRLTLPTTTDILETIALIESEAIANVSGTPTFWRKLLTSANPAQLAKLPLRQITLGGEIVSQGILSALRRAFPHARLTHIYASTEMGVCFSVKDGLEGFPSHYLQEGGPQPKMMIHEGELLIQSERSMTGYDGQPPIRGGWFATGDLVEIRSERVFFLGRRSEVINVGGNKVFPDEVEEQLRQAPGVVNARVFGAKSSFAGQLVSAEVEPAPGCDGEEHLAAIRRHCAATLPAHKNPRFIQFVSKIQETSATKVARI